MPTKLEVEEKKLEAQALKVRMLKRQDNLRKTKAETRRLVLMGALINEQMKTDSELKARFMKDLDKFLVRNKERILFDFHLLPDKD